MSDNKENVIIIHDGYEKHIRELKEVIDILELNDDDSKRFAYVIEVLREKIWEEFDEMCGSKAQYTGDEYREMLMKEHWKRRKAAEEKKVKEVE